MKRFVLAASQKPALDLPKLATFLPFDPAKENIGSNRDRGNGEHRAHHQGRIYRGRSPHRSIARGGCDR